ARYRARRIGAFPFAYRGLKNITSLTLRFHVFQRKLIYLLKGAKSHTRLAVAASLVCNFR
ncbi:MAG: hypothetical protein ABL903_18225, partial [Methylococcales bacterium]